MNRIANTGDQVEVSYAGKLKDQTVFDSSEGRAPLKFTVGSPEILKGFSEAVIGMKVGDKKTFELSAEEAYGQYDEKLLFQMPKDKVPANAVEGDLLSDSNGNNWIVRQISQDSVIIDGNHPLAGQPLIFEIELLTIV